jgi:hypothetical protein
MAVWMSIGSKRRSQQEAASLHISGEVGDLVDALFSGDRAIASEARMQLNMALKSSEPGLQRLSLEQWEKLLFPIKFSDDGMICKLFGEELQLAILRAVAQGEFNQGIICARFATYRARSRRVRRAARECLAALEGLRKQPTGNLARAAT